MVLLLPPFFLVLQGLSQLAMVAANRSQRLKNYYCPGPSQISHLRSPELSPWGKKEKRLCRPTCDMTSPLLSHSRHSKFVRGPCRYYERCCLALPYLSFPFLFFFSTYSTVIASSHPYI
ncbi:hypothetical protein F4778DRAFT_281196 [Xylariomycetidae sp. FL2044]|nr:hypothetical protein F4778DRAFT_281196 [Xylariomycetidae sp. FL2044]